MPAFEDEVTVAVVDEVFAEGVRQPLPHGIERWDITLEILVKSIIWRITGMHKKSQFMS